MSAMTKVLKLDIKKGQVGGLELGESIGRVLTYIQMNVQTYGRIEIVNAKDDAKQPLFIILPDSGNSTPLTP